MISRSVQIPLDFGHVPAFAEEDFLVAGCNAAAHGWIARWPDWPGFALALTGPAACGKSHLAHLFAARSKGRVLSAAALTVEAVPHLAGMKALALEDADQGVDETALFHLYNLLRETRGWLLLTGREAPSRWGLRLPDLTSRLATLPVVSVAAPDDVLLLSLLLKLFSDRQLKVGPDVPAYLLARMERSFLAVRTLVETVDAAAMAMKRPVTIPLLREVLPEDRLDD